MYAGSFDGGAWRRDAGAAPTAFQQVFAPRFAPSGGVDRVMFAFTVKNGHTRIYLTDGTANGGDGALVVVVAGLLATYVFDLGAHGVALVGAIPRGLPGPTLPELDLFRSTTRPSASWPPPACC